MPFRPFSRNTPIKKKKTNYVNNNDNNNNNTINDIILGALHDGSAPIRPVALLQNLFCERENKLIIEKKPMLNSFSACFVNFFDGIVCVPATPPM